MAAPTSGPAVLAWVEDEPEVLGDAADLADALGGPLWAIAAGAGDDGPDPAVLAHAGADRVLVLDAPEDARLHAQAIAAAVDTPPAAVLLAGTSRGAELAPRVAVLLDAPCLLDCAWLRPARGRLVAARWAHDDRALERWEVAAGTPLVATLRPGGRGPLRARPRTADVVHLPAPSRRARVRRLRRVPADPRSARLPDAQRVVAAGLGIGSRDTLPWVQELADRLGATLGASRPLADRGWVTFERQVGTTGQPVAARLYVAIGISGASQHLDAVHANTLVAVNTDPACPMMARATLAAVGDAAEVVEALLARLPDGDGRTGVAGASGAREPAP